MNFRAIRPSLALSSSVTSRRPMTPTLAVFGMLAASLMACAPQGSFREVKVAQGGGEVALEGDRALAHQKAEDYMKSKCQAGYTILEEGEATVGTDTSTSSSSSGARTHGFTIGRRNQTESSTRDATEWRVKYQCKDASPAPAAGPAAASPATGANVSSPSHDRVAEVQEVRVQM